jgi:hypothetical protein
MLSDPLVFSKTFIEFVNLLQDAPVETAIWKADLGNRPQRSTKTPGVACFKNVNNSYEGP